MTHLLRYLLIFGERKKKVELSVSNGLENVKVKTLKQKARELFNLKNVLLQIWDKGFEDWVDLDEGDPTPTNSRIKVEVDKEAKSVSDISVANRMPSKPAAVKPSLLVGTPKAKADPPMVQVLSSYPMMSMTTTEPSQASPTSKALPALALIKQPHPQAVAPKLSPGKPRKILPAGQRQFMGEQPQAQGSQAPGRTSQAPRRTSQVPERTSSLSAGEMLGVRQDIQDDRVTQHLTECSRGALWGVTECKYLIGTWCSDEIQSELCGIATRRNKPVYKRIALRLADMGFPIRPWDRVRDKVNRMKSEYRKIRRQISRGFSQDQIAFPIWYAEIDAVYGSKLACELPDLVGSGDRDDLSSTTLEDQDEVEDQISDDNDNYSADSGTTDADTQSGHSNRTDKLFPDRDGQKAMKDTLEDESGGDLGEGDSRGSINGAGATGEGDDAWIAEDISEEPENESEDDTLDGTTTDTKDFTATRGIKRRPVIDGNDERSKRASGMTKEDLVEENSVEGERDELTIDERNRSKHHYLRKCQVKIETEDYDDMF